MLLVIFPYLNNLLQIRTAAMKARPRDPLAVRHGTRPADNAGRWGIGQAAPRRWNPFTPRPRIGFDMTSGIPGARLRALARKSERSSLSGGPLSAFRSPSPLVGIVENRTRKPFPQNNPEWHVDLSASSLQESLLASRLPARYRAINRAQRSRANGVVFTGPDSILSSVLNSQAEGGCCGEEVSVGSPAFVFSPISASRNSISSSFSAVLISA